MGEIDAGQEEWAGEFAAPLVSQREAPHFALLTSSLRTGADTDLRKPAVTSPAASHRAHDDHPAAGPAQGCVSSNALKDSSCPWRPAAG